MAKIARFTGWSRGRLPLTMGWYAPSLALICVLSTGLVGCNDAEEIQTLDPVQLGMTDTETAFYDDGEITLYQVNVPVSLPIIAPDSSSERALGDAESPPYPHMPWVTQGDVGVQVTWTISNLDEDAHDVELLIDPWNEFARYYPGLALVDPDDMEYLPNFSGIQHMYHVPGIGAGSASRVHGTYTYQDMKELAIDFATVIQILNPGDGMTLPEDIVGLVNHVFNPQNHSGRDVLADPWTPTPIAGLTGFDLGLRTREPANIAVEILIELSDPGTGRVLEKGEIAEMLGEPDGVYTVGVGP